MSDDPLTSEGWKPARPCREEVTNVARFLRDSLIEQGLRHDIEQVEENADCWSFMATDSAGYHNFGLISWHPERGAVTYVAYDPLRARHDEMEGIGEDDSRCWWSPPTAMMMLWHLNGYVREVMAQHRAVALEAMKREDDKAA